jgi:hypothetical protein
MGDRNADQRGGVDRTPIAKVKLDPLDNPDCMAHGYRADLDNKNKQARLVFYKTEDRKEILGFMLLESNELYEFAEYLLRNYDKLEGLTDED